ncbi:MAG: hypothetical protein M3265_06215 [Actinomycetota bacterium]|nr:hypothetical protein [Actinomycetota bacterium]
MDEAQAREYAQAHAQAMENGELERAGADVADEFRPHLGAIMRHMPRPLTRAEVLSVEPAGEGAYFSKIRYTGEDESVTFQARWASSGPRPQIVDIQIVE